MKYIKLVCIKIRNYADITPFLFLNYDESIKKKEIDISQIRLFKKI